jgi:hypothetical protein
MEYLRWKCTQENGGGAGGGGAGGKVRIDRKPSKLPPTKLARLGHFPPASQAGRLAGLVFYVYVFSLIAPV